MDRWTDALVRTCFFLPAVDGGVALSEPTDSWQFVLLTSSTEIHNHIVLRHHQLQSAHYEPDTYREAVVRWPIEKALNRSASLPLVNYLTAEPEPVPLKHHHIHKDSYWFYTGTRSGSVH